MTLPGHSDTSSSAAVADSVFDSSVGNCIVSCYVHGHVGNINNIDTAVLFGNPSNWFLLTWYSVPQQEFQAHNLVCEPNYF